jgi:two-component system sensor histidine kinase TctE
LTTTRHLRLISSTSLRRALIRRLALALTVIGIVGVVATFYVGGRYASLEFDNALFDNVVLLSGQLSAADDRVQLNLPTEARKLLLADGGDQVVYRIIDLRTQQVIDANGDLGPPAPQPYAAGQPAYRDVSIGGRDFRVSYTRTVLDPLDIPVLVEVGETLNKRSRMRIQILAGSLLIVGAMILAAVMLVWQGVGRTLMPLRELEDEARQRSGTNLTPLNPALAPQEVRGLIEAINRMMARVSDVMDSQQRFIANAAHQLRTPIAGLRLQAQLGLQQDAPTELRGAMREIEQSAARATHLIEQLLTLSRVEDQQALMSEDVDLLALSAQTIERQLAHPSTRDVDLGFDTTLEAAHVTGNAMLLGELLGNLINNAVLYGDGPVTVRVDRDFDEFVLSVTDNGPGLPPERLARAFERFVRSDAVSGGGAGLGLAIVKEIADRHHAVVRLVPVLPSGCRAEVRFAIG